MTVSGRQERKGEPLDQRASILPWFNQAPLEKYDFVANAITPYSHFPLPPSWALLTAVGNVFPSGDGENDDHTWYDAF